MNEARPRQLHLRVFSEGLIDPEETYLYRISARDRKSSVLHKWGITDIYQSGYCPWRRDEGRRYLNPRLEKHRRTFAGYYVGLGSHDCNYIDDIIMNREHYGYQLR